jgi:tetratricopeptide (TPR) repeat protein
MLWKALIAHAPGEEALAERIALPLQQEGYSVSHRGTVLVGDSFSEEADKALGEGGPVILCATVHALGTGWAHRLVNAARARAGNNRLFVVRMEESAYVGQIAADLAIAEWWRSPEDGSRRLIEALRSHYPLEKGVGSVPEPTPISTAFVDRLAPGALIDWQAVRAFRGELRETMQPDFPSELTDSELLEHAGFLRQQSLTLSGVLLFGTSPASALPWATTRCVVYRGKDRTADREPVELRGTIPEQIRKVRELIAANTRVRERPSPHSAQAERIYEYPMLTTREIVANALVHRDYEDESRCVHVRLFSDRIEVLSPGAWTGRPLPGNGSPVSLETLVSESVKRNLSLATALSWIRLVEGEGSGLPAAIEECREISAPIPSVSLVDGFVRVIVWPRRNWAETPHPAAVVIAPHQLPPPPADLTGREEELRHLHEAIRDGTSIAAIVGLGGVGKTALALRLAQELEPSYPDAQIFLDLQGSSQAPLGVPEAMAHVIRSLAPESRLPRTKPELAGLYRSLLAGRRTLIFLDDAAGPEQVLPLTPPPSSFVVVTSRSLFHLPGLFTLSLDVLSLAAARALLLEISPRLGDRASEIAALCGSLPLALRLAGGAFATRPDLSVEDYVRHFAANMNRLHGGESIGDSIGLSYELLAPAAQSRWRQLAVFPGGFDRRAATAVWGCDREHAEEILGELVRHSMLAWEGDRYRLHDLLRLFADSKLEAEEMEDVARRHARHFLDVLRETSALYVQGGFVLQRGLALFDLEWENIQAGQSWSAQHASGDTEAATLCTDYPIAGAFCLDLRLHPREWIRWLEVAAETAERQGNLTAQATHYGNLGNAFLNLGDLQRAAELYQHWLDLSRRAGDRRAEGQALGNLGSACLSRGETGRAIECFEQCLEIARQSQDREGECIALGRLGNAYAALGEARRAVGLHERRLLVAREVGDRRSEGIALGNLGSLFEILGDLPRAVEFLQERLAIAREVGDRRGEGIALGALANAFASWGQPRRAIHLYEESLWALREVGDRQWEAEIRWNLGTLYEATGELRRALALLEEAYTELRASGHPQAADLATRVKSVQNKATGDAGESSVDTAHGKR